MKLEPVRHRETTSKFYGKKGMSWHGCAVFFGTEEDCSSSNTENATGKEQKLSMFFIDTVVQNDSTHDVISTIGTVESIVMRICKELPLCKRLWFFSDNAKTYQNDLLPVMLPQICLNFGIKLVSFLHPEAQNSKNMVDGHFAVAKRHIVRFVQETTHDVITPIDVVEALTYDEGIKDTATDFVFIDRCNRSMECWNKAYKDDNNIDKFGNNGEYIYDYKGGREFSVRSYRYSGGEHANYLFGYLSSKNLEMEPPDVIVDMLEGEACTYFDTSKHMEIEMEGEDGGRDTSDDVRDERSVVGRPKFGNVEKPIAVGTESGVKVIWRSEISRRDRAMHIHERTAFGDVTAEMELVETEMLAHTKPSNENGDQEDEEDIMMCNSIEEPVDGTEGGGGSGITSAHDLTVMVRSRERTLFTCPNCLKQYRRREPLEKHKSNCKNHYSDKKTLSRGVEIAQGCVSDAGDIVVYKKNEENPLLATVKIDMDRDLFEFEEGWARRTRHGASLGKKTVKNFKDTIRKWYDNGNVDPGKRMSAAMMRNALYALHPNRYDLPCEYQINSVISQFSVADKKKQRKEAQAEQEKNIIDNYLQRRGAGDDDEIMPSVVVRQSSVEVRQLVE